MFVGDGANDGLALYSRVCIGAGARLDGIGRAGRARRWRVGGVVGANLVITTPVIAAVSEAGLRRTRRLPDEQPAHGSEGTPDINQPTAPLAQDTEQRGPAFGIGPAVQTVSRLPDRYSILSQSRRTVKTDARDGLL